MTTAPVLDTDALNDLGEQLGDPKILSKFLRCYVAMLDQRIDRLDCALATQDHVDWMDAILSLTTSSTLAGAKDLAVLATALQEESEHGPSASAGGNVAIACRAESMELLRGMAEETARQLRIFLQQVEVAAAQTAAGPTAQGRTI